MQDYYLTDITHDKKAIEQARVYDAFSKACLKYGCVGGGANIPEKYVREFWSHEESFPSEWIVKKWIRIGEIKWYIHNTLNVTVDIWNGDFLHGMALNGQIKWGKSRFPSFIWNGKHDMKRMIESSPFGGRFSSNWNSPDGNPYRWMYVPALYLKFQDRSISFMAGAFASGEIVHKNGKYYVRYRGAKIIKYLKKWGVPIEYQSDKGTVVLISPVWPALLSLRMPECHRDKWMDLEDAAGVNLYCPILWRTYIDRDFETNGFPYLKSRRWIYYNLKVKEETLFDHLDIMRLKTGLVDLDIRFRHMIHQWTNERKVNDEVSTD